MAIKVRVARLPLAVLLCAALVSSLCVELASAAEEMEPRLKVMRARSKVTLPRYHGWVSLDLGAYLAAFDGPLELQVTRPVYREPLVLKQIVKTDGGSVERELDGELLDGWNGLSRFFRIRIKDLSGNVIRRRALTLCPGASTRERVNDEGPMIPRYPMGCYANAFSTGMVWGIEEGWAVALMDEFDGIQMRLPEGKFDAVVSIAKPYASVFGVDPADRSVSVRVIVRNATGGCLHCMRRAEGAEDVTATRAPEMEEPAPEILPDLKSTPAWGIDLRRRRNGSEFLTFGATVWTAGASSLVVEGFRQPDADVMDAYQYFYENGEVVGRSQVGTLEYDNRRGHKHWHFLQFAAYSLVDRDKKHILRSKKEAFCLAPTDAIDMTLPNAEWHPYSVGLGTACGSPNSLWVREVLPLGWGDTYTQSMPGQSFNVTKMPNGVYFIKVEANPGGLLHEQDKDNNVEYRKVVIKGRKGARYVKVPAWNGIDSESFYWDYWMR